MAFERVGEAVAKVQPRWMPAAHTEVPIGLAAESRVFLRHWLDGDVGDLEEIIEPAAGDRVAARVGDDRRLERIRRGNPAGGRFSERLGTRQRLWLVAEDGQERGGVNNYRGSLRSS